MSLTTAPTAPAAAARVPCSIRGCRETFVRLHDMERHVRNTHFGKKLGCPIFPGQECGFRGAIREHLVRKHVKEKHPEFHTFDVYVPRSFGYQEARSQHQNGKLKLYLCCEISSGNGGRCSVGTHSTNHVLGNGMSHAAIDGTRIRTVEPAANNFSQLAYLPQVAQPSMKWNDALQNPTAPSHLFYLQGNVVRRKEGWGIDGVGVVNRRVAHEEDLGIYGNPDDTLEA
ncbi:hypothetical protein B0J14DRAFT_155359 [Halenospora varia]|nr:hypothetical protein B0J14DRAFT_155359 [Halenospora varia]